MSKLSKLKLVSNISQMSDEEMKFVVGGSGSGNCQKKACSKNSDCSGYCANISSPGIAGCIGSYCM